MNFMENYKSEKDIHLLTKSKFFETSLTFRKISERKLSRKQKMHLLLE